MRMRAFFVNSRLEPGAGRVCGAFVRIEWDAGRSRNGSIWNRLGKDLADLHAGHCQLESPVLLCGRTVPGFRRGRTFGCPTANLPDGDVLAPGSRLPEFGIYCGWATLLPFDGEGDGDDGVLLPGHPRRAVLSWGVNPQFGLDRPLFEVHLMGLKYEGDLYGRRLLCMVTHRLREERSFPGGLEVLRRAIELDMALAWQLLEPSADQAAGLLAEQLAAASAVCRL